MTYDDAIAYLQGLVDYERKIPGAEARHWNLERIGQVLAGLGNPQESLRCVHVAGTKGKGSTCAMIASILQAAGYRVGLFTSPHLASFRERIRINGELIPREAVAELVPQLQPHLAAATGPGGPPSFFEAYTALALAWFARQGVDVAVLETGLGGRLDATNIVKPLVSVITRIAYDHTVELGDTLELIAAEKAGIMKAGVPVISTPQVDAVWRVLRETAVERRSALHAVRELAGPPTSAERLADTIAHLTTGRPRSVVVTHRQADLTGIGLDFTGLGVTWPGLRCPLIGEHQFMNAGAAVGAVRLLEDAGLPVPEGAVRQGLWSVQWAGRLQVASKDPWIVLDGAHDAVSAVALRQAVGLFAPFRLILVLGINRDKDIEALGRELCPLAAEVIFTTTPSPRAAPPEELAARLGGLCRHWQTAPDAAAALKAARELVKPGELVLVAGSLYLVGEAQRALGVAEED